MDIILNTQTEDFVKNQLNSGRYHSLSELVNAALNLMSEREQRLAMLKIDIQKGILQAENSELLDENAVLESLRKWSMKCN